MSREHYVCSGCEHECSDEHWSPCIARLLFVVDEQAKRIERLEQQLNPVRVHGPGDAEYVRPIDMCGGRI